MCSVDSPPLVSVSLSNVCDLSHLESKVNAQTFLFLPLGRGSRPGAGCELVDPDRDSSPLEPVTGSRRVKQVMSATMELSTAS